LVVYIDSFSRLVLPRFVLLSFAWLVRSRILGAVW
jgi:hypothetical protein